MSLTGWVFLDLIVVCTVVAFIVLILRWPTVGGHSLGRIAARTGMLLTVNFLVLLTAATQLNAQFLFFADWTDLKGAFGGAPTMTALSRGGAARRAARVAVVGAAVAPKRLPALPIGTPWVKPGVFSYTVKGSASGITGQVFVELPPGYTAAANAATRYPVIETFQGYPGGAGGWLATMDLGGAISRQVAARRMRPALIVLPMGWIPAGVDTECVNGSPGNPQLETWLAKDVPAWVAKHFRVRTERGSWATMGYSAGGWCAAMTTMLNPAQYSAAIVLGGYFRPEFGPFYQPYPPGGPLARRYDLVALAKRGPPPVAIWLETSHSDTTSYPSSAAFLKATQAPTAVDAVVLRHAGHRFSLWAGLLPKSLVWLGKNVPGFSPLP